MRPALAALLGAAAAQGLPSGPATRGPTIAPSFSVRTSFLGTQRHLQSRGGPWHWQATLYYDESLQGFKVAKEMSLPFLGPGALLKEDNFGVQGRSLDVTGGQCYPTSTFFNAPILTGGFDGLFGWARDSEHVGHDTFDNQTCDVWRDTRNWTLCVDGDEPVYVDVPMIFAGVQTIQRVAFHGPIRRHVDPAQLVVPTQCDNPSEVCGEDVVEVMHIYLAHPQGHFNISDQNVADARGDVTYMCSDDLWQVEDYKLATFYEVSVLQKFGQYLNCNLYDPPYCVGSNSFFVGREAPLALGIRASQCDNSEGWWDRIGTWYSLPAEGRCTEPGQEIGRDCTWRIERRVKTIQLSCLFDKAHGFLEACKSAKPPYQNVVDIYLRAFASEDPSDGGCPSVAAPEAEERQRAREVVV